MKATAYGYVSTRFEVDEDASEEEIAGKAMKELQKNGSVNDLTSVEDEAGEIIA